MTLGGFAGYLAPEVMVPWRKNLVIDFEKNDEWMSGLLFHSVLSSPKHVPFPGAKQTEFQQEEYRAPDCCPEDLPRRCVDLVSSLLRVDPQKRLASADAPRLLLE